MKEQLDRLINKYGKGRKYSEIARRMAEIELEPEKDSYSEREWLRCLRKKKKTYETYFSSYIATIDRKTKVRRPRANTLLLISQAIECDFTELEAVFYPEKKIPPQDDHPLLIAEISPLKVYCKVAENHNLLSFVEEDNLEQDTFTEQYGFKCLEIVSSHVYFPDYSVEMSKTFKILCLRDNLSLLEDLDSCQFFAQEAARIDCQDERFIVKQSHYGDNGSIISLKFHQPLRQGQIIEGITIKYSCNKLDEGDNKFGSSRVLHETDWLILNCTPPSLKYFSHAQVCKYANREDYLGRKYGVQLGNLSLGEATSFGLKVKNPTPYAYYGIYWG